MDHWAKKCFLYVLINGCTEKYESKQKWKFTGLISRQRAIMIFLRISSWRNIPLFSFYYFINNHDIFLPSIFVRKNIIFCNVEDPASRSRLAIIFWGTKKQKHTEIYLCILSDTSGWVKLKLKASWAMLIMKWSFPSVIIVSFPFRETCGYFLEEDKEWTNPNRYSKSFCKTKSKEDWAKKHKVFFRERYNTRIVF